MNETRRGFFGLLGGLYAALVAAWLGQPSKAETIEFEGRIYRPWKLNAKPGLWLSECDDSGKFTPREHLEQNGLRVIRWIPMTERTMPTTPGLRLIASKDGRVGVSRVYNDEAGMFTSFTIELPNITHWAEMPLHPTSTPPQGT